MQTEWRAAGWEADYFAPYLVLTNPDGDTGLVQLLDASSRRNVTLQQFRSSVASHGAERACKTFWKLRAN